MTGRVQAGRYGGEDAEEKIPTLSDGSREGWGTDGFDLNFEVGRIPNALSRGF